jgi:hypothetical protein
MMYFIIYLICKTIYVVVVLFAKRCFDVVCVDVKSDSKKHLLGKRRMLMRFWISWKELT